MRVGGQRNTPTDYPREIEFPLTLVDLQLDAQNSYLFTYNTFIKFFLNRCTTQSPADSDDTRGCIYTVTT
jgi:hypothetical protein